MRITHFITGLGIGGAERALYNRLAHPAMQQHDHIVIYLYDGPVREDIENLGIKTIGLTNSFNKYTPSTLIKLTSLIKSQTPDIIHTALWSANTLGRIAGKFLHIPVISDLHGKSSDEGQFRNFFERRTHSLSTILVAVSKSVANNYIENIFHYSNKKSCPLVTIPNGINLSDIDTLSDHSTISRSSLGLSEKHFIIGAVGRLEPIKNYGILISAIAVLRKTLPQKIMSRIRVCIVGNGSEEKKLKQLCSHYELDKTIIFAGQQQNPHAWYEIFDCFTLSSRSEGLSIALLEALAHNLPVITTNDTLNHDVIVHEEHGLIVTNQKPEYFANALTDLILNEKKRYKMKENIKNHIAKFDLSLTLSEYNNIYQEILCKKLI